MTQTYCIKNSTHCKGGLGVESMEIYLMHRELYPFGEGMVVELPQKYHIKLQPLQEGLSVEITDVPIA